MKSILIGFLLLVLVGGGAYYYYSSFKAPSDASSSLQVTEDVALAPEIEEILSKEIEKLEGLAAHPTVVAGTRASNEKNRSLGAADIARLDKEWQDAKGVSPFIAQFLGNPTAGVLLEFKVMNTGFSEIFVADSYGLNVGQTDKTSDYYQADESWWVESYADGVGKSFHGKIEFDQSAQSEAISLYVPIMDGERAIGVIKGVLDLAAIKEIL